MISERQQQFLATYEAYANEVFRYCHGRTSTREEAVKCVQTVFCSLWARAGSSEEVNVNPESFYRLADIVLRRSQ